MLGSGFPFPPNQQRQGELADAAVGVNVPRDGEMDGMNPCRSVVIGYTPRHAPTRSSRP